jgi:hypothetical protein
MHYHDKSLIVTGKFCTEQSGTDSFVDRGLDFYETPGIAVEALLQAEPDVFCGKAHVYEPAASPGNIARVLRKHGIRCTASDLVERDFQLDFVGDFLTQKRAPDGCTPVVTKPPYRLAEQFSAHALTLAPAVFLLLGLGFLASTRRTELLEQSGLRAVYVFRKRLPRMHRDGWDGRRVSSSMCFAWFVWRRGYCGSTIIDRV